MTTATDSTVRYLRTPRLPRVCPVTVLHVRADNDRNGNPRRAFVILAPSGRTVQVIDEGYGGEGELRDLWPWFDHTAAARLGITTAYTVSVDATPAEYRRWIRQGDSLAVADPADIDAMPDVVKLRAMSLRAARWMAVRSALTDIRRHSASAAWRQANAERENRMNGYAESDAAGAIIYHRTRKAGGDVVSEHLRSALASLVRAGAVERLDDPAGKMSDTFGRYRATDSTPDLY